MGPPSTTVQRAERLAEAGELAQAEALLRRAVSARPRDPVAALALTRVLLQGNKLDQAVFFARSAVALSKRSPEALVVLGAVHLLLHQYRECVECNEACLAVDPRNLDARNNRAVALAELGRHTESERELERLIAEAPGHMPTARSYAFLLERAGRMEDLVAHLRRVCALHPRELQFRLSLAYAMLNLPTISPREIADEHRAIGLGIAASAAPLPARDLPRPGEVVRVGFFSGDFRDHSVSYFIESILEHLDRERFYVACYYNDDHPDGVTARLRGHAQLWRDVHKSSDEALARQIADDGIHVLFDLAGYTGGNRFLVFARRPAPVQATYIGYPATTGLPTIHYRVVDSFTDPPGSESLCTEALVRVDPCFLCYRPPADLPQVVPRARDGAPVFGSFNALRKLSDRTIEVWSRLMHAVPGSRLILKSTGLDFPAARERLQSMFSRLGIDPSRVELVAYLPRAEHLPSYGRVDVALDPFPYTGTTTTCEALVMGVPVVTLAGEAHAGRVGVSLLHAVGLGELIASSEEEYVRIAAALAHDRARLATLRATLRDRVLASPLCDARAFARGFGSALLRMIELARESRA